MPDPRWPSCEADGSGAASEVVLSDAELPTGEHADVRLANGRIAQIGRGLRAETMITSSGGALLPGLHDHHCHLLAAVAEDRSIRCGPPHVTNRDQLAKALRCAVPNGGWLRGTGYDTSVAGDLDRYDLDTLRADVPIRVQHRSGALWILNSVAVQLIDDGSPVLERDGRGKATGRLWRADAWLRHRLGNSSSDGLASLSRRLASYGITGVTDATPDLDQTTRRLLAGAGIRQRVFLLGDGSPAMPRKIVVGDHDLPTLDNLVREIARTRPRRVAIHSVTRESLLLTLAAFQEAGGLPGDRIEHAAVAPPEAISAMAALRLTVVTQPSLVWLRGDDYLDRVDPADRPFLWPYASLAAAGVPVGCSSDAPYGDFDPWLTLRAALSRKTASGRRITPGEAVPARSALNGFLSHPHDPGGPPRQVAVGALADLTLLDVSRRDALAQPSSDHVLATFVGGRPIYQR